MRIYVSSTSEDLKEFRAAAIAAVWRLGHFPAAMEGYVAETITPVEKCLRDVASSDLYIGIFAYRYGYVPDGVDQSITEMEYRKAREKGIPTLAFLLDESIPWPGDHIDTGEAGERIRALREGLKKEKLVSFFKTPDELGALVTAAVAKSVGGSFPASTRRVFEVEPRISATPLFGRGREVRHSLKMLERGSLAVTGIKGIGKSKLVSAIFERIIQEDQYGFAKFYWRRLSNDQPLSFMEFVRRLVRDLCGIDIDLSKTEEAEQVQLAVRTMRELSCLLVIDQLEAVIDPKTRVPRDRGFAIFLTFANQGFGKGRLLLTSWDVPRDSAGLDFPSITLRGLDKSSSRKLIMHKLPQRRVSLRHEEALSKVAGFLQGHPYVLELIARNISMGELESIIKDNELWHGTIAAISSRVASEIVSRLSPLLMDVLASTCIFLKPCSIDGIIAVADAPRQQAFELVSELQRRSFVTILDNDEYDTHIMVREHILNGLASDEERRLNAAAAAYYLSLSCPPPGERSGISDVRPQLDAAGHYCRASMYREAAELLLFGDLANNLMQWGYARELLPILSRIDVDSLPGHIGHRILGYIGLAHRDLGDNGKAEEIFNRALDVARKCGDRPGECLHYVNLGDVNCFLGEYAKSVEYHRRARVFIDEGGYPRELEARNFGCLGNALLAVNDLPGALECYESAIAISREIGEKRFLGIWLGNLGAAYQQRGELEKAIEYFRNAVALARVSGDMRHESWWLGVLGHVHATRNEYSKATELLDMALSISDRIMYLRGRIHQLTCLFNIAFACGDTARVKEYIPKLAQEPNDFRSAKEVCLAYANRCMADGRYKEVIDICDTTIGCFPEFIGIYGLLGRACATLGKRDQSRGLLNRAVDAITKATKILPDASLYESRAACHFYLGNLVRAAADYGEALKLAPEATGAALSKMETEVCLGLYRKARETFGALNAGVLPPVEKVIAFCLVSLARSLDGMTVAEYLPLLEDQSIVLDRKSYDPRDMAPYLDKLSESGMPEERVLNARRIYSLFLSHYPPEELGDE